MIVQSTQVVEVPTDLPLAKADAAGNITLYPEGMGKGPVLHLTVSEWRRITSSVEGALSVARQDWSAYIATEGNGAEL